MTSPRVCAINLMLHGIGSEKSLTVKEADALAADSNKPLNFGQHIKKLLKRNGRAAVVVPDDMLSFDKTPASETPWTRKFKIYDLPTNKDFTLKTNPLKREDQWVAPMASIIL